MFYVYVHRRADTGAPFYVGKGKGARMRVKQHRSNWWRGIVKSAGGFDAVKVLEGLDEELAHLAEIELIDRYRRIGVVLCNLTDGGEGMSGFKFDPATIEQRAQKMRGRKRPDISERMKGVPKSAEHRANLAVAKLGLKASDETRAKQSAARKGQPSALRGRKISAEHRANITRNAPRGKANPFFGRKHTPEAMAKIMLANVGRKESDETRAKKSAARIGALNPLYGVPVAEDRKAKQRATLLATIDATRINCPHCAKRLDKANATRWHLDRCKERK